MPADAVPRRCLQRPAHIRQPRHGGVPRPATDDRRSYSGVGRDRVRRGRRGRRVAGVPPRFARRLRAAVQVGGRSPLRRRRHIEDPNRQGRQSGNGARGSRTTRLAAGAVPHEGRSRRQLQAAGDVGVVARLCCCGPRRVCQPQPVRPGLGARPCGSRSARHRDARRHGPGSVANGACRCRRRVAVRAGRSP